MTTYAPFRLRVDLQISDQLLTVVDASAFTNRNGEFGGTRIDQVTASIGIREDIDTLWGARSTEWSLGSGMQMTGDFGLDALQNSLHKVLKNEPVYLPYEDVERFHLTAWGSWNQIWDLAVNGDSRFGIAVQPKPWYHAVNFRPQSVATSFISGAGSISGAVSVLKFARRVISVRHALTLKRNMAHTLIAVLAWARLL